MVKKEEFYNLHSEFCKSIFNPKRLAIIDALRNNSMNVNELSGKLKTSQSNISQHLGILKSKGLVKANIEGNCTYYHISNNKILEACDMVSEVIKEKYNNDNKLISESMKSQEGFYE